MKKIFLVFAIVMGLSLSAAARDEYSRDESVLPAPAKTMLSNYFKADVSMVKIEKSLGRIDEYEVILDNGTEVKFDRSGNWKEVETSINNPVPKQLIPEPMADYVKKNHKNTKIVGLEKDRNGFEVELSNGIEMKFDKAGNFLRYDN